MPKTANKTDPKLWEKVKSKVTKEDKGGKSGQWSARKAQLAVHDYKSAGGHYEGSKQPDNHLAQWTKEEWNTRSGAESGETSERYLPRKARESLTEDEHQRTTAKKRADSAAGKQFSAQPADVARKTSRARRQPGRTTRAVLLAEAGRHGIRGRFKMKKAELQKAIAGIAR